MTDAEQNIQVSYDLMRSVFRRILIENGFPENSAIRCGDIFALNSLEGVYSHGVNRFSRFIKNVREGYIKPEAVPVLIYKHASVEQWNGNLGPGPLNATFATERAMEVAHESGIGLIGLANTNHWMRAGTYGWQAARKGFVLICWTNTCANMPAWGATDPRLGNNPLVMAIPYNNEAIVLDSAMSQYSYGKMETFRNQARQLPSPGGYNIKGELTTDPGEILETWRALPSGFWKGSGFSLLLDILATILSGGLSTHEISRNKTEFGLSQVFIAINIACLNNFPSISNSVENIIDDLKKSTPVDKTGGIRYPGENVVNIRAENLKNGIPVDKKIWDEILNL